MPTLTTEKQATLIYNGMSFTLQRGAKGWDITYPKGTVGTGLFGDADETAARAKARAVIRGAFPVGVKVVGPDINHSTRIGDLKLVPPDVGHPNFVQWNKDSVLP
ncbi:MAG: hypothetical protein HY926_08130 [Elusimicrobia bacterium]|nr:hypothetical protein [Elusimicrobiota bacterium]